MTTTDPYGVEAYHAAKIPDAEIPAWQAARILAPRVRGFRRAGVTPSEAVALRNQRIVSAHGDRYRIALAEMRRAGADAALAAA